MPKRVNHIVNKGTDLALCGFLTTSKKPSSKYPSCYSCISIHIDDYNRLVADFNDVIEKSNEKSDRLNIILNVANPTFEVSDL